MASTARGRDPAVEEEFLGALYKGGELLAAGKIVEAREHLEKAHRLEPKNEKAQNLLGLTYFKLGLYDDAARIYESLVRENPVDPTLRVNLGLVYLKTNALERSIKELETAIDLAPSHQKAHNYLGLALAQAGEYARAREHFHAAGSEAMAEKMTRALVARAEAAADDGPVRAVPSSPPATAQAVAKAPATMVKAGAKVEAPPPSPPSPPVAAPPDTTYDVMTDEEVPSDAFAVPEQAQVPAPPPLEPKLDSDWGAQFASEPPALAAPPEAAPPRSAGAVGPSSVPVADSMPVLDASAVAAEAPAIDASLAGAVYGEVSSPGIGERVGSLPEETLRVSSAAPAWLTMEANEANQGGEMQWVTEGLSDVPLPPTQPTMEAEVTWGEGQGAWGPSEGWSHEHAPDGQAWEQPASPEGALPAAATFSGPYSAEATPYDAAVSTEPYVVAPTYTGVTEAAASTAAGGYIDAGAATPGARGSTDATAASPQTSSGALPRAIADAGGPEAATTQAPDDASVDAAFAEPTAGSSSGPIPPVAKPPMPGAMDDLPAPNPSGPDLPIDFAPPVEASALLVAPAERPAEAPAGYTVMRSQRLVDIGAASGWVREPSGGPFHLSREGLAVTVHGEMRSRLTGLVAMVGGLEVTPEVRRKRGRPTGEAFGERASQLHRITGNGVLYLEPGRHRFFAVDLTDTDGASVDDDGAYLKEEVVFAFEEPVAYENGRITGEGLALDLVHLKGEGKALLQLDGAMKAMPIPPGAPMVVPLRRFVGWFGRVTPRLLGFGGQGAVELKGDGYALLETPGERA